MPAWLINVLVKIAISVGVPYLVKLIPGIPLAVIDIINQLLEALKKPEVSNSAAKKTALANIRQCIGVGCATDIVKE